MARIDPRCQPTDSHERAFHQAGYELVAGVDEVGRGSWAGPIVAAAVILPLRDAAAMTSLGGLRDSKMLSAPERDRLCDLIFDLALGVGIGSTSHHVIDRDGLGAANRGALLRAVKHLRPPPDAILVDYFRLPECSLPTKSITGGDARCVSIAAASVVAKVVRDRWMGAYDNRVPGYGFASHKGYGTRKHRDAIAVLGPSPIHRLSFRPFNAGAAQ